MQWASAVSTQPRLEAAIEEAAQEVQRRLQGTAPSLILAFVSPHHAANLAALPDGVRSHLGSGLLIGCSAGGVIGAGREIEHAAALSITAAVLPGVELAPFHLPGGDPAAGELDLESVIGVDPARQPHFVLLPDPFTFDTEVFLPELDRLYPTGGKVGGLASGGQQPGSNALLLESALHRAGLVGVALTGNIELETIVAQGCRPIGQPMFATKCARNIILELDGQPAGRVLEALVESLSTSDQRLVQSSLFLGIVMSPHRQEYRQGDFLIRNIIGMDATRGALAVGALLDDNAVVQFHLRDAHTSADDLEQLLRRPAAEPLRRRPAGALLFSCLGRGEHLYGHPNHDSAAFERHFGTTALGGFFCNGEIGPVHGTTFLHGYTSAFGLFRSRLIP
jgi:small ligand-binding sensory domain FIST